MFGRDPPFYLLMVPGILEMSDLSNGLIFSHKDCVENRKCELEECISLSIVSTTLVHVQTLPSALFFPLNLSPLLFSNPAMHASEQERKEIRGGGSSSKLQGISEELVHLRDFGGDAEIDGSVADFNNEAAKDV